MPGVLDAQDWQAIQEHVATYDAHRETVIKQTRDAQKSAKQAIYSLHRGDFEAAGRQLQAVEHVAKELLPIVQAEPTLRPGSYAAAMEEYAEAMVLQTYLREGRILRSSEVAGLVQTDEYLSGVLDFTGELSRHAVARATARDVAAVARARDVVDALQGAFLCMDLRNGSLRKKFDVLKHTLRKLETMLYELSLTEASGGLRSLAAGGSKEEEQPPGEDGSEPEVV